MISTSVIAPTILKTHSFKPVGRICHVWNGMFKYMSWFEKKFKKWQTLLKEINDKKNESPRKLQSSRILILTSEVLCLIVPTTTTTTTTIFIRLLPA